jgi:nitroreductase
MMDIKTNVRKNLAHWSMAKQKETGMDFFEAVEKRFSVRAFKQEPVSSETLAKLVDAARKGPSAANRQPLEYIIVNQPEMCGQVFGTLKWAALLAPKGTPVEGQKPTAYIICLRRKEYEIGTTAPYDVGSAMQTICLGAVALGLGTCWIKSINYPKLSGILEVPEELELDSVLAIGVPTEFPKRVDIESGKTGVEVIKYWRDENEQHFVPKRGLEDILHQQKYGK